MNNCGLGEEASCWESSNMFAGLTNLGDGNDEPRGTDSPDGNTSELGTEDHVLVYPRRKLGQEKMGSDRPPVVVTREYLESTFHIPLTVVAKKINISATVLKQLCRRVGIAKWPYKRRKANSKAKANSHVTVKTEPNRGHDMRLVSPSNSAPTKVQHGAPAYSSWFQGDATAPGVPVVPTPPQEQTQLPQASSPSAQSRITITHTAESEAPLFSNIAPAATISRQHSASLGSKSAAVPGPHVHERLQQLEGPRSPPPLDAPMELATGKVCKIPEPADSLNPEPEGCLTETSFEGEVCSGFSENPLLEPLADEFCF